jgi:hypothetical protein
MAFNLGASVRIATQVTGTQAVDQLRRSLGGLDTQVGGIGRRVGQVTNLLKGFAAAFVVREAVQFGRSILDTADNLRDMAQKTGIGVEALSKLKTAAELNGSSLEGLQGALRKFTVNLTEADKEGSKVAGAFKALGVSAKDANGELRPSEEILFDIADRFKELEDGPNKAAIAVRLFGKAGADLIPILNQGSEEIQKFGLNISQDFADRADQLNDTLTILGVQFKNFSIIALDTLLPVIQDIANAFSTLPGDGKDAIGFVDLLGEGLRIVAFVANDVVQAILQVIDTVKSLTSEAGDFFSTVGAQAKAVAQLDFTAAGKLRDEYVARSDQRGEEFLTRSKARLKASNDFYERVMKNSLIFGEGSVEEIRARTRSETKAPALLKGSGQVDASALDTEADKRAESAEKAIQKRIRAIETEREALGKTASEVRTLNELRDLENYKLDLSAEKYATLSGQVLGAVDALEQQRRALEEDPWAGAKRALDEYVDSARKLGTLVEGAVSTSLQGLEDAFVDFFTKGKADWAAFANTVIAEITRIAVKKAIIAPLAEGLTGILGFADGGVMTSAGAMPLKKYANGGVANSPQLAMFGEGSRPEAFVPLPDGRRIPVAMEGGGGGNVNVSVSVNVESGETKTTSNKAGASQLGDLVAGVVKNELLRQKRPGGLLA